jgi:double-stranded uracil-DNA glycosylase
MSTRIHSLAPVVPADASVLILGSMPGATSLGAQQYYAHPRNAFWPLMAQLCAFDPGLPYLARLESINAAGIGLWDVLASCERAGSLDTAINTASVQVNPIDALVCTLPKLRVIALNGAAAHQLFRRHLGAKISQFPHIEIVPMPSSSPAHAARTLAQKWTAWRALMPFVCLGKRSNR